MKTIQQIKDEYSIDLGYKDWESLMTEVCYFNNEEFFHHENEVMVLVQKECLKNASENAEADMFYDSPIVIKKSITNENNIIK